MGDLVERLREHAYRVGPNDSNYDPETLDLETAAADRIEELQDRVVELEAEVELNQRHIVALQEETVRREIRLKEAEAEVERLRAEAETERLRRAITSYAARDALEGRR